MPVEFEVHEGHHLPLVQLAVKFRGMPGIRIQDWALLDTGSHVTLFSQALLALHRVPVHRGRQTAEGGFGIGGHTESFTLPNPSFGLLSRDGQFHGVDLDELHFVREDMPTILGRDVLEALNAVVHIDFCTHQGDITLG